MASEEEGMDSLFEGMVLFTPSKMAAPAAAAAAEDDGGGEDDDDDDDGDGVHQLQETRQPISVPPHTFPAGGSSSANQPLDENLFSDLTLITPDTSSSPTTAAASAVATDNSTTAATTVVQSNRELLPSSLSRQISAKKKKRAGLRIGYGRDASIPNDQHTHGRSSESDLPPPSPPPLPAESESGRSAPHPEEEEAAAASCCPSPDNSQTASLSSTATTPVERDYSDNIRSKEVDPSPSTAANGASGDVQVGDDQVNTSTPNPIELRFEQIRAQISEKLGHVRDLVASVSAERKDSTRKRRKAAEAVNNAATRYRELEKELEEACEAEDFETAERVSESLASAEEDKERLALGLRHAEADCDAVDSKMQEVLEWQIAAEEECSSLLKNFALDAANDADQVQKNAEVASEKELERWLSLTEDSELKKMELDIEAHLINASRSVLSDSIEHSVEDDRRERELLCKRKEMLTGELEKLLALVKEKEMEIAETDCNIETVEKRIADVVSSFQEVRLSIDSKYDNLRSGLSQMELDNEALARKKKEIDDFLSQEKERGIKLQEFAQISANEANMYQEGVEIRKSLVLFILKSREEKVRLVKTEDKLSEDVHMLREEISAARASLQELSSSKSSFQQEIESLNQRLVFINKRVPELEAEKKVAAAARNFREAARIATESKTLSVEKESLQVKMEGAVLELGKLEEEICNTVNRLQETEGQISTKEKEVAMARFHGLLLIAGAAKAERSAALELGDLEEADALSAEAEAAETEARKIQPVYDFKEEEFDNLPKQYISMELVSHLGGKQLAELAASVNIST